MGKTKILPAEISLRIAIVALCFGVALGLMAHYTAAAGPDSPDDNNVLICHMPPPGPMWIWVNESAVDSHLDHGDYEWTAGAECGGKKFPGDDGDDQCEDRRPLFDDGDDCGGGGGLHFMHLPVVRVP